MLRIFHHLIVLETSPLHSLSVERQHTATSRIRVKFGWFGIRYYLSVRQTMQEMEKSKWSSLAWRFDDFSFPCKFTTCNVVLQFLSHSCRDVHSCKLTSTTCNAVLQFLKKRTLTVCTLTMLSWQTRMVSFSNWVTDTMFISSWRGTTVCVPSASSNSSLEDLSCERKDLRVIKVKTCGTKRRMSWDWSCPASGISHHNLVAHSHKLNRNLLWS